MSKITTKIKNTVYVVTINVELKYIKENTSKLKIQQWKEEINVFKVYMQTCSSFEKT